jgi:hypothetical protein
MIFSGSLFRHRRLSRIAFSEQKSDCLLRVIQRNVTFDVGVEDLAAEADGQPAGGRFDFAELTFEIGGGAGDGRSAEGGAVPEERVIKLGDRDVEAVAELVLEGTHDLAAIFEGVRVLDGELKGEGRKGHVLEGTPDRMDLQEELYWLH